MLTRIRRPNFHKYTNMASLLSLPPEMLVRIFKFVEPGDLKSLRSTCKCTEPAATPLLAKEFLTNRRHVLTMKSIKDLEDMVSHPYFGPFVRSIAFNCVRKTLPYAPFPEDIGNLGPPFQINDNESFEESGSRPSKIYNIIRKIQSHHGKISLGVFFENLDDQQPCHGLTDGLKENTIDNSDGCIPTYSMMFLRDTLRSLLQMCSETNCPVDKISIDLGSMTKTCIRVAQDWDSSVTILSDIRQALADHHPSLHFKYGADDSRYKTFSYDHSRKTLTMFNSSMDQNSPAPRMKRLFGTMSALGSWLGSSEIETLDLTGAGNCTTSARSLQNIFLTPCHISLKHLRLKRMQMGSIGTWSLITILISQFPALETCELSDLTSFELSADELQGAEFIQIFYFKADGRELKKKLENLAAQLQAHETAWRAEALDSPTKWMPDLGPKIDSRVEKKIKETSTPEAQHEVDTDTVLAHTPEPHAAESTNPASNQLETTTPGAVVHGSNSTSQLATVPAGTNRASEEGGVLGNPAPSEQNSEYPDNSDDTAELPEDLRDITSGNQS